MTINEAQDGFLCKLYDPKKMFFSPNKKWLDDFIIKTRKEKRK